MTYFDPAAENNDAEIHNFDMPSDGLSVIDPHAVKTLEHTQQDLLDTLRDSVRRDDENEDTALFRFMAQVIADEQGVSDLEECFTARESHQNAFQLNGFGHRNKGETLVLCIAKYEGHDTPVDTEKGFKEKLARSLQNYLKIIDSGDYKKFPEGGEDREVAERVAALYKKCTGIQFFLMTDRFVVGKSRSRGRPFNGRECEAVIIGPEQYFQTMDVENASANVIYDVTPATAQNRPLDFTEPPVQAHGFRVMQTFVSGKMLFDMYSQYGDKIMRQNVRALLSVLRGKNRVNAQIAKTLRETPEMFSSLNNGLTMLATKIDYVMINGREYIQRIHGPQIVNGGQTTGTIFSERKSEANGCYVSCKVIVYDPDVNPEFAKAVALASNDQTKINVTDLSSNHAYFVNVEKMSRSVSIRHSHHYFARVRAQYETEKMKRRASKEVKRFSEIYPLENVFVKSDIAATHSLFVGRPHHVNAGAESNFKKWAASELGNLGAITASDYKLLVAKIILWRKVKAIITDRKDQFKDYRNYISNYVVSFLAQHINSDDGLMMIWNDQGISSQLSEKTVEIATWVDSALRRISGDRAVSATVRLQATWEAMKNAWDHDILEGRGVDLNGVPELMMLEK